LYTEWQDVGKNQELKMKEAETKLKRKNNNNEKTKKSQSINKTHIDYLFVI
jgi:hypothetical protein